MLLSFLATGVLLGSASTGDPYFLDTTFNPARNLLTSASALAISADGKVLVAGEFASDSGRYRSIVRLDENGNVDPTFRTGTALARANSIALAPDGGVAANVVFDSSQAAVVKLAPDGTLLWQTLVSNFVSVSDAPSIMALPDGTFVVAGAFTNIGGLSRQSLALLGSGGSVQPTFDLAFNGPVTALARTPDGLTYAGGGFTTVNGLRRMRLVRLDPNGSVDLSFDPREVLSVSVSTVALQRDGKILIGGVFNSNDGANVKRIIRLLADGSVDPEFRLGSGPDDFVERITVDSRDRIVLAGFFNRVDGVARLRLARLLPDGTLDPSFNPASGPNGPVRDLVLDPQGRYVIAGSFDKIGRRHQFSLARFHSQEFGATVDFETDRFTTAEDNLQFPILLRRFGSAEAPIVVEISTTPTNRLSEFPRIQSEVRFEPNELLKTVLLSFPDDGEVEGDEILPLRCRVISGGPAVERRAELLVRDDEFPVFFEETIDSPLHRFSPSALAESGGLLAIGGGIQRFQHGYEYFTGVALSRMDGTPELVLANADSFSYYGAAQIHALAWTPDNKLVVGGRFHSLGSYFQTNLIRLNSDGTHDSAFKPRGTAPITALLIRPDGKIIAVGEFVQGGHTSRLAQLTSSGDLDRAFQPPADLHAHRIALQADGKLLASSQRSGLVRLLADGTPDSAFEPLPFDVESIQPAPEGTIYISGAFHTVRGVRRMHLARLHADGSLDLSFNPEVPVAPEWRTPFILLRPDGKLLVAAHNQMVRLHPDGSVDPTLKFFGHWNSEIRPFPLSDGRVLILGGPTILEPSRTYSFLAQTNIGLSKVVIENSHVSVDESTRVELKLRRIGNISKFVLAPVELTNGDEPVGEDLQTLPYIDFAPLKEISTLTLHAFGDALIESDEIVRLRILAVPAASALASEPAFITVRDANGRPGSLSYLDAFAARTGSSQLVAGTNGFIIAGAMTDPITLLTLDGAFITNVAFPQQLYPWHSSVAAAHENVFYVAGNLAISNEFSLGAVYRILADGRIDPAFKTIPLYLVPRTIAVEPNGKILVGGGRIYPHNDTLYRFRTNGTIERSWPLSYEILHIASLSDGNVAYNAGGHINFLNPNLSAQTNLNAIAPNSGIISSLVADGASLYVAGTFTNVNQTRRTGIVRTSSSGEIDPSFAPEVFPPIIYNVAIDDQKRVLISGDFQSVNGIPRPFLARLLRDGSLDLPFEPGAGIFGFAGERAKIESLAPVGGGSAFAIVEHFNSSGGHRVAQLMPDLPFSLHLRRDPAGLQLSLNSQPGRAYRISSSINLRNWYTILETNAVGHQLRLSPPPPPVFFRAENLSRRTVFVIDN